MPLEPQLIIGGHQAQWPPPAESVRVEPLYASSEVIYLSGRVGLTRGPLGGHRVTLSPADTFVVGAEIQAAVMDAWASGTPLHLVTPDGQAWPACQVTTADFKQVPGSDPALYTYSITFLAGV